MKTPILNELHKSAGARMGEYAGWMLPMDYGSAIKEATAVRTAAGLFDVSHMGRVDVIGKEALGFLQKLTTNDVALLSDGAGQYTLMCNEAGGVKDDLILYRHQADRFLLVLNASNLDKDKSWLSAHVRDGASIIDCSTDTAMFALQGPKSAQVVDLLGWDEVSRLRRFHFVDFQFEGMRILAARTGYTGEDGFEIICSAAEAESVWSAIIKAGREQGVVPCGLAARDILRIEAGLPLYGHEMDEDITPVEAGLVRFVRLTKGEFIGRAAIAATAAEGTADKLVGILMEGRAVPRSGDVVVSPEGRGRVTSGTYSPALGRGIAMAYLPAGIREGSDVYLETHGGRKPGVVQKLPFCSPPKAG